MSSVRAKVRDLTTRRSVGLSVDDVVTRLNRVLRGWGDYVRYGHASRKFDVIDRYVRERLAIFASDKHGLPGRNSDRRFTTAWFHSLGVYRLSGTVRRERRMPGGERCRRAVCGRTARTVRQGAAGDAGWPRTEMGDEARALRPTFGPVQTDPPAAYLTLTGMTRVRALVLLQQSDSVARP